jgi:hypothetical protein
MDSTFIGNRAVGGNGGSGNVGEAAGGGVFSEGTLVLSGSVLRDNQAVGGSNNTGATSGRGLVGEADGGGLWNAGEATITYTTFEHNEALGGSGNGAVLSITATAQPSAAGSPPSRSRLIRLP